MHERADILRGEEIPTLKFLASNKYIVLFHFFLKKLLLKITECLSFTSVIKMTNCFVLCTLCSFKRAKYAVLTLLWEKQVFSWNFFAQPFCSCLYFCIQLFTPEQHTWHHLWPKSFLIRKCTSCVAAECLHESPDVNYGFKTE